MNKKIVHYPLMKLKSLGSLADRGRDSYRLQQLIYSQYRIEGDESAESSPTPGTLSTLCRPTPSLLVLPLLCMQIVILNISTLSLYFRALVVPPLFFDVESTGSMIQHIDHVKLFRLF